MKTMTTSTNNPVTKTISTPRGGYLFYTGPCLFLQYFLTYYVELDKMYISCNKCRYFFDSDYYLNDLGDALRTEQLVKDSKAVGI